jgi:hypothetical protein
MNTSTRAAFATVAEADVFAAEKTVKPLYQADMDFAAGMASGWSLLADCGSTTAAERFYDCLHTAMGWRPEHTADELAF